MRYRNLGKDGFQVSILGFGTMRLPLKSQDPGDIDLLQAVEMIRLAVDEGVNYIDTAYGYHNGNSEKIVGQALGNGYRAKVRLATKLPPWLVETVDDMERIFCEQLSRLETDRIDCYLLHALNDKSWKKLNGLKVLDWARKNMERGRIGQLGFSFHDGPEVFKKIIAEYPWDFCQIQYNYMDTDNQAGSSGLEYASSKGIPVIVMEPLRGGALADPPENIRKIFQSREIRRTPVDWGLFWAWSQPGVSLVLSGMSSLEQVRQNLEIADRFGPGKMSEADLQVIDRVKNAFLEYKAINCTQCSYCLPCPCGVNIPENFAIFNEAERYRSYNGPKWQYANRMKEQERAGFCTHCGRCLARCPQKLPIPELLDKVHKTLNKDA